MSDTVAEVHQELKFSEEFLNNYKDQTPPWGPLGYVTYKRTYARWIPSKGRTEEWWETCQRVLEGNFNMVKDPRPVDEAQKEMELAYDLMWNMVWLPPGRGLWISGTESARKNGTSLNNCWVIDIKPGKYYSDAGAPLKASLPFVFAMDVLMLGGGVGTSVTREGVDGFDTVSNNVNLHIVCDPKHQNISELEASAIPPRNQDHVYIRVKDARRGWTDALRVLIDAFFKNTPYEYNVVFDMSDVRPAGRRIKGFGGTSAGPGPLVRLLRSVHKILKGAAGRKLTPLECADIVGHIGKCVVAGNVRRSAILHLFSADDKEALESKLDMDMLKDVRWTANISASITDDFEDFEALGKAIATNGEPGVINLDRGRHYGRFIDGRQEGIDANVTSTNPCSEIFLDSQEPCCLVEIFPAKVAAFGASYEEVAKIAYRYAKRVTCATHEWEPVTEVVSKNRRIGVSLSGWEDWKNLLDNLEGGDSTTKRQALLDRMYKTIREEDAEFSELLGINESIKVTTVKPSGTISLLNGSSAGRHAHYSKFYIRRIRLSYNDPMVDLLREAGFKVEEDVYSPNTVVAEFPVKAPTADFDNFKSAEDYTLEEQCKDQMELQTWWADNSVSSTLTFKEHEAEIIPDMLRKYKFKSTSLLPYSGHGYEQAPYEPIDEETYDKMVSEVIFWPNDDTFRQYKERRDMEILDQDDCEGGACPIK